MPEKSFWKTFARSTWGIVALTAGITLILAGSLAYFLGLFTAPSPPARENPGLANAAASGHDHEKQLYTCGMHPWIISEEPGNCPICGMKLTPKRDGAVSGEAAGAGSQQERKIAYWRAPMNPREIYDKPGKSAMGMDLVPVYEDEVIGGVEVKIDPAVEQNMGLRTAAAEKRPLAHTIRTYGHVTFDETRTAQVNTKFNGWIETLHVDITGQFVKKGEPLFSIYSPELLTAQEEYLSAYRNLKHLPGGSGRDLLASARRRLQYFDVAEEEIRKIETTGRATKTLVIRSPFSGVVVHKDAVEGAFIKAGATIYQIADLSRVWVEAHIYEYELPWVKTGQPARMTLSYLPGREYTGKVAYVYPYLQPRTRDVVVRLEFPNPGMELKPDMYAEVVMETDAGEEGIVIPAEAVIRSGKRDVVFVARGEGKFTPREVTLGLPLQDNQVQVLSGVAAGETVVTSGQFLLDSESKLKEAVQKMMDAKDGRGKAEAPPAAGASNAEDSGGNGFFEDMEDDESFFQDMEG